MTGMGERPGGGRKNKEILEPETAGALAFPAYGFFRIVSRRMTFG